MFDLDEQRRELRAPPRIAPDRQRAQSVAVIALPPRDDVAALRLAQRRAREREEAGERDVTTLPPPPAPSRAPVVLWCLGLAEVIAYAWLLSSM